jgi:putative transposase
VKERRAMIEPASELSIRRQCALLGVSRSGVYYEAVATSADELALMRRIDALHLETPFYGSRKIVQALKAEGRDVNRKCVQRLMRLMGVLPARVRELVIAAA